MSDVARDAGHDRNFVVHHLCDEDDQHVGVRRTWSGENHDRVGQYPWVDRKTSHRSVGNV